MRTMHSIAQAQGPLRGRTLRRSPAGRLAAGAVCGLALLVVGCRANDSAVLLERDLRMQEDKIYHLQSCLEDAQAAREATLRENESLKHELAETERSGAPSRGPAADFEAPSVELPGGETLPPQRDTPDLAPPTIELPGADDAPGGETAPAEKDAAIIESPPTQLVINKRLTGGLDRDGHGGDEGLLIVFEPRDAAGHLVRWPGKVSVVAMDPAQQGEAARVARWDFPAEEVPAHYLSTVFGRGLQFELPWPGDPPDTRELKLFVRFTTEEGQKLTTDTTIEVRPPGAGAPSDRQTRRTTDDRDRERAEDGEPRSRLKARAPRSDAPRSTRAPSGTDSAAASPGDGEGIAADAHGADGNAEARADVPLEAARPKRPEWKPFR
ncbi:MAG: hypothetical protein AB7O59_02390 [Pirellulales bacterium]